jgi:glycosyltransferase involved in cell wall biosynthesis
MRIAYLFDRPLPAKETDSEQVLKTVAALSRRGHALTLVLPRAAGPARSSQERARELCEYYQVEGEFEVHELPSVEAAGATVRKWVHARRALRHARTLGPDLVYTRNFPTLFCAAREPTPFAYETYRPWPDQFPPLALPFRWSMAKPHFLGAVLHSEFVRERYAAHGIDTARLIAVLNGYDPRHFSPRLGRDEARDRLGLPRSEQLVVYTGHINATKGLDIVLAMAKRCPEQRFLLVGSEGKHLIERLGQKLTNVTFVPWQPFDKVVEYLFAADVLLVPPSNVPHKLIGNTVLPMKLFLYLASGRPIFAAGTPDNRELLRDQGEQANAVLVRPGDAEQASAALRALFQDRTRREQLGAAALRASVGLTWDTRAERIEQFLLRRLAEVG